MNKTDISSRRVALYFAPPFDHPLWVAGCSWLGRDAREGQFLGGAADKLRSAPWHYGFHATLKAPMHLASNISEVAWLEAVTALAERHTAFEMPSLEIAMLSDFLAIRPSTLLAPKHPLRRLADDAVELLDPLRAPLSDIDRARLSPSHLNARQREQVARWGYAHVFDDWRFHMTLTNDLNALDAVQAQALQEQARQHFALALQQSLRCDAIYVYAQSTRESPFFLTERVALKEVNR